MAMPSPASSTTISSLNSLLQGERSAVATYTQAQNHLKGVYAQEIDANLDCHAKRVEVLAKRITSLGGQPSMAGGMWVGLTKVVEQTAAVFGNDMVIRALEEGEDVGLSDYKNALEKLDPESKSIVLRDLLPAQERTHQRMSRLKHAA